jgi:hypothetical protein
LLQIDAKKFLQDLANLRRIGAYKNGVHRLTYSPWLARKFERVVP